MSVAVEARFEITSDVENGEIAWSNELVAHVVELKPTDQRKISKIQAINFIKILLKLLLLATKELQLLPTHHTQ